MNAEFNWWLLIVGLVIGAALVWVILADSARREADVTDRERDAEAAWIAEALRGRGARITDADVREILDLHAAYLATPPPDDPPEVDDAPIAPGANGWREAASLDRSADAGQDRLAGFTGRPELDERHAEPRIGRES